MREELMNRARELLALRDKATPGPWHTERNRDEHYIGHRRTKIGMRVVATVETGFDEPAESEQQGSVAFLAAAHDMADTISDLMAEVERLRIESKKCGAGAGCCYTGAKLEAAEAEIERLRGGAVPDDADAPEVPE